MLLLVAGLVPWALQARVFQTIGMRDGRLNTAGLPWEFAYNTTMTIDGRRNELFVYSARFSEPAAEQLKDQFEAQGATVTLEESRDCMQGMARWDDREARLLVLSPDTQPNQMIFVFYPEPAGVAEVVRFPVAHYPRSVVRSSTENQDTGTGCISLETNDSAEQVQAYYAGMLAGAGWKKMIPGQRTGPTGDSMTVYQKKKQVCCVMTTGRAGFPNRVTVLVKGRGL